MTLVTKREYLHLIRAGRKTTTIRLTNRCGNAPGGVLRPGPLTFTNYHESVRTRCTSVVCVRVGRLTHSDACADGFASRADLLDALRLHYPTLTPQSRVWIVRFELENDSCHSARATA